MTNKTTTCGGTRRVPWPEAGLLQDCPGCADCGVAHTTPATELALKMHAEQGFLTGGQISLLVREMKREMHGAQARLDESSFRSLARANATNLAHGHVSSGRGGAQSLARSTSLADSPARGIADRWASATNLERGRMLHEAMEQRRYRDDQPMWPTLLRSVSADACVQAMRDEAVRMLAERTDATATEPASACVQEMREAGDVYPPLFVDWWTSTRDEAVRMLAERTIAINELEPGQWFRTEVDGRLCMRLGVTTKDGRYSAVNLNGEMMSWSPDTLVHPVGVDVVPFDEDEDDEDDEDDEPETPTPDTPVPEKPKSRDAYPGWAAMFID